MTMDPREQMKVLHAMTGAEVPAFHDRLTGRSLPALSLVTLQVNVGKLCNQTCKHCHVDAGPTRKEVMTRETMEDCLRALDKHPFKIVDITGGAPEMNPHFRWFVEQVKSRGLHVMARCNLTIIEAHAKYADLPEFYARHKVEVVSSLPSFAEGITDRQRGKGVFGKSVAALKKLNAVGYGSQLPLHLVYNPNGAFLPGNQAELEAEFKAKLKDEYGIVFNSLFTITNMPISRFLEYLIASGNLNEYMKRLSSQFNPAAVETVMCRTMLSVSWDGGLYDCDFNQMLELKTNPALSIRNFDPAKLLNRKIVVGPHCYGCTAGSGSSCGGSLV